MKYWFTSAIVITLLCGLIYASSQQVLRMSANDPQIQLAEDTAATLSTGQSSSLPLPEAILPRSLSPFIITYTKDGQIAVSSVIINGKVPSLPPGVLDTARRLGESRFTWEPSSGVRIATVVVHYTGQATRDNHSLTLDGFVLAGRSLREVEVREQNLLYLSASVWIASLVMITGMTLFLSSKKKK